jgi:hypothetical protein
MSTEPVDYIPHLQTLPWWHLQNVLDNDDPSPLENIPISGKISREDIGSEISLPK